MREILFRSPFASILLATSLIMFAFSLLGCSGGGGSNFASGSLAQTPEEGLRAQLAEWKITGGPILSVAQQEVPVTVDSGTTASGTTTSDTTASSTSTSGTTDSGKSPRTIRFQDFFSEEQWELQIDRVEFLSPDIANIYASFIYRDLAIGQAIITFRMIREEGVWRVDDITVESLPIAVATVNGIQGYVLDTLTKKAVVGALVTLFREGKEIARATTDSTGFYRFLNLSKDTYDLVITRKDYQTKTISGIVIQ